MEVRTEKRLTMHGCSSKLPLCRVYTRTHVTRIHVSRTSNLYLDTIILCRWIHVDGYKLLVRDTCWLYRGDIITIHLSRLTCIPLYPATDGRQTGDNFVADTRNMLTCDKWMQLDTTCIRQHVSWSKRGIRGHWSRINVMIKNIQ